jgi:excisionase family DNA binding protein
VSEKRGYSPEEAAHYLGIAVSKVRRRMRERTLPIRKDGRDVIIERADLDAYLDRLPSERGVNP